MKLAKRTNKPNLKLERELQRDRYLIIAGVDEAGRGSWAGPVVAAAVVLPFLNRYYGINDSKLLTAMQREQLFSKIHEIAIDVGIGVVENKEVDVMGVGQASYLAMRRAVNNLSIKPSFVLVDGFKVGFSEIPSRGILDGDRRSISIAAASIIAKVARDRMMEKINDLEPQYGFNHNKGYGTVFHQRQIKRYGINRWHRRSFKPIQKAVSHQTNLELAK